jgi:hypothetical protein
MATGHVNAIALNLRATPNGAIIGLLRQNCPVDIVSQSAGWLEVDATQDNAALHGWVSAAYVVRDAGGAVPPATVVPIEAAPPATVVPIADDNTRPVRVVNDNIIGPAGETFGQVQHPAGFYVRGSTTLTAWLRVTTSATGISPSSANVLQAVINNEGHMEAVNSYDDAFLSFGLQQWTCGSGDDPGELPGLLQDIQALDSAAFQDCFGRYGLAVQLGPAAAGSVQTGFLSLGGNLLNTAAAKQALRSAEWAYRFWRAGHVDAVRRAQAGLAAHRIRLACGKEIRNHSAGAWLTSEYAVALLLDEHVNRPSHVPHTLSLALDEMIANGAGDDPTSWGDPLEAELIRRYIAQRNATTMTNSAGRAQQISKCLQQGMISDNRGSYLP